jgi:hypothetical protein
MSVSLESIEALSEVADSLSADFKALGARLAGFKAEVKKTVQKQQQINSKRAESLEQATRNYKALHARNQELEKKVKELEANVVAGVAGVAGVAVVVGVVGVASKEEGGGKRKREEEEKESDAQKVERVKALISRQDMMFEGAATRECATCKRATSALDTRVQAEKFTTDDNIAALRVLASRKQSCLVQLQVKPSRQCLLTHVY